MFQFFPTIHDLFQADLRRTVHIHKTCINATAMPIKASSSQNLCQRLKSNYVVTHDTTISTMPIQSKKEKQ